jgi:ribosome biogenesis protein NSA1
VTDAGLQHTVASLPMRLCSWRLSSSQQSFAYGGEEVELSVWDTEKAFSQLQTDDSNLQKRKRDTGLLPAEVWRAKNVCDTRVIYR